MRPRLLDLFCKAGGAGRGYDQAGFDVFGVDWEDQPNYPYPCCQADAVQMLLDKREAIRRDFDAVHASPPCQGYTALQHAPGAIGAPRLITAVRELLEAIGLPYVLENVEGAKEEMPGAICLCGSMFGLGCYGAQLRRHRLFISNVPISPPGPCRHDDGPVIGVYGGHARLRAASHGGRGTRDPWPKGHRDAMARALGMDWGTAAELSEAIPPAYTAHLGAQLLAAMRRAA